MGGDLDSRRWSRRGLLAAGAGALALGAVGCADDEPEQAATRGTATIGAALTPPSTQLAPTPTQPPLTSPVPGYLDPARWQGRTLIVASPGVGDYLAALESAFLEPFADATGATVQHQQYGPEGVASLQDQVDNDDHVWDVVLLPASSVLPLARAEYLAPIDYNVVDPNALYDAVAMQHGVGAALYATVIVYPAVAGEAPADWPAFWDLSRAGGTRALRRSPVGTFEFALLADGVEQGSLYPLDTPRAFGSLERIRAATLFWEDSKQPVELVRTGQVGLAAAWTARTVLPDVASLIRTQWRGGMMSADSWVIPRGITNIDMAMSFIGFATRAIPTANFARLQPFAPVNRDALTLLRPDVVESLPTAPSHVDQLFFEGWSYWADNLDRLTAQFEEWLLSPPASPAA